jgi:gluconolactonase
VPDEFLVTNICFGSQTTDGAEDPDRRTAFITAASSGRLVSVTWPRPGLALPY